MFSRSGNNDGLERPALRGACGTVWRLSGAARALQSSPQTVGRRIAALEAALGVGLFVKHASGYRLTPDGEALLADAELVEKAMAGLQARASGLGGDIVGLVRIAAPETIANHILLPGLRPLFSRNPRLQIELDTGVGLVGMARGEADIALRLVRPERGALTVRKIGTMGLGVYAMPGANMTFATARFVGRPPRSDLPGARC